MFRIVSHNTCWFQGFPYEALDPDAPHPEVLDRLTAIYRKLEADVVCLQEVQHAEMANIALSRLETNAAFTPGGAYPHYGCATYSNQAIQLAEGRLSVNPPQRAWQICRVGTLDSELIIANVHLTSDRFLTKADAAQARMEDLRALLSFDKPIDVICGDFNEGPREAAAITLEHAGFIDAAIATGTELPSTGVGKKRSDQIWIRKELEAAITGFGATDWDVLEFLALGKKVLSDHLPLWLELNRF